MIFVTGTGRSGTSALARALSLSGVSMGRRFREPDKINPRGYWEDLDFVEINRALVSGLMSEALGRAIIRVLAAVREEPWGAKDPRFLDLSKLYQSLFSRAKWIIVKRDHTRVIESLKKAYRWSEARSQRLVAMRTRAYLKLPEKVEVNFEDLLEDPKKTLSELGKKIDVEFSQEAVESIETGKMPVRTSEE